MATKRSVIELNGNAYDALSGAMLGPAQRATGTTGPNHRVQTIHVTPKPSRLGFRTSTDFASTDGLKPAKHGKYATQMARPARHAAPHQLQPTKTLMRRAVAAPQAVATVGNRHTTTVHKAIHAPSATTAIVPKFSSDIVDPRRLRRATTTTQSQLVQHFAKTAALPPSQDMRRPVHQNQTKPAPAKPVKTPPAYDDRDIFEKALAHATGHQERAPQESRSRSIKRNAKKQQKVLSFVASLAAFVLLCGFVAYQNKANIQLQLASAKAGFSASVPLYKPDGYDMGKLTYATGAVALTYNNANSHSFDVLQKKSNWDSQTLLENFVATSNEPYQGYQSGGRTIYVYGQGKATWVNGGIWYQIDNATNLSSDQIVKVAASM